MDDLDSIQSLDLPSSVLDETWTALRQFGSQGHEGFVLWLGVVAGPRARISLAVVPPQQSIRSEDGVGYFVSSDTLFRLNLELYRTGLRLIAQVHSHPGRAYHSATDDAYAVVTTQGGLSLVVPDFAVGPPRLDRCAIYRLRPNGWCALSIIEIARLIVMDT